MKIRNDFVTNSSSSSFVFDNKKINKNNLLTAIHHMIKAYKLVGDIDSDTKDEDIFYYSDLEDNRYEIFSADDNSIPHLLENFLEENADYSDRR